jgi:RHS repeat-associated protein
LGSNYPDKITSHASYNLTGDSYLYEPLPTTALAFSDPNRTLGNKNYELTNHLSNILVVITDMKYPSPTASRADLTLATDYYPFGSAMPGRSFSEEEYRFGFGSHENDDEIAGSGNHLSFGDYGYSPRLGRRWRPDPLQAGMPSWSPYAYSLNNPIMFVDEDGKWPGVTYMYFELDIGAGLGWGLNYVEQLGIAYDEVGKTHFTMTSELYIVNQNLQGGGPNPEIVAGATAALSAGITQDWSNETFLGDISGYNGEMGGLSVYAEVGGEIGFGEDRFTAKVGIGGGVKLSILNTKVKQSISLTDAQASVVNDATDIVSESWILNGVDYNKESKLWEGTVATRNTKGELIDTGIKVSSANVTNDDGSNAPSGVWTSQSYRTEAAEAEKK